MPVPLPVRPTVARPRADATPRLSSLYLKQATVRFGLALALAVSAALPAPAGTYAVTFSGGTYTHAWSDGPLPDFYNGDTVTSDLPWAITDCSGAITATLTWQPSSPTDAPPQNVLVVQTCSTDYWALGVSPPTASACDGLGDPEVDGSDLLDYGLTDFQGQSNGTHYSLQRPDASGTVVLTLSGAHADLDFSSGGTVGGGASLAYTVDAYPVNASITLTGTTTDSSGNLNILVGQGCTASMNASASTGAGPITLSNFQWSPGADTFANWQMASDQSWGSANYMSGSDWAQPSPHWYYKKDGTATVSCTATVSISGTSIGTITASQPVVVWVPYYTFCTNTGPSVFLPGGNVPQTSVEAGSNPTTDPGMKFTAGVGTPYLFANAGYGQWLFVQLCNINDAQYGVFSPLPSTVSSGGWALDNEWPYDVAYTADSTSDIQHLENASDSPELPLFSWADQFTTQDQFQTFLMYSPPGTDVQWVPLHKMTWDWTNSSSANGGLWYPDPPGGVQVDSTARCYDHPFWSQKYVNPH